MRRHIGLYSIVTKILIVDEFVMRSRVSFLLCAWNYNEYMPNWPLIYKREEIYVKNNVQRTRV